MAADTIVLITFWYGSYPWFAYINATSTDSGYLAKVILPQGLITSYKKYLQYSNGLTAQADIITEDMRLLERFYYNIAKQLKR